MAEAKSKMTTNERKIIKNNHDQNIIMTKRLTFSLFHTKKKIDNDFKKFYDFLIYASSMPLLMEPACHSVDTDAETLGNVSQHVFLCCTCLY